MPSSKAPFTVEECREFIEKYRLIRPDYERLAKALTKVLEVPAKDLGLPAMVQARPKDIASFAGKIQRPEKGYIDPLKEITDFCGARVITLTLDGVERICDFVEKNFDVLWEHSEDKLDSLESDTFGYRSRHYIVSFRKSDFPEDIVPPDLIGLKAEVQVRTLLQHAWADVAHEFSYKTAINLPEPWKRELARLAAMLEDGDLAFDWLQNELLKYATSYEEHYSDDEIRDEIARTEIVLEAEPGKKDVAHKLAKMAMILGDWQKSVAVLTAFEGNQSAGMLRDLGVSLTKLHGKNLSSKQYAQGQAYIQDAIDKDPRNVDAWASLGGSWRTLELESKNKQRLEYRQKARECYRGAYEVDASDPYALANYIEYELIAAPPGANVLSYLRPAILASIERCEAQAEAGVNLPWAYLSLGEFYLFLGEPVIALRYYSLGIECSTADYFLKSPARSFDVLDEAKTRIVGLDWARSLMELALAVLHGGDCPGDADASLAGPVVIVAGSCSDADAGRYRDLILDSFAEFNGTVISGGTVAGIAADVGELGAASPDIHTVGYVPGEMPKGTTLDARYDRHRETDGTDFSPLEILQYWRDIKASGVAGQQVTLIAFGGGELSALECWIALAMGAEVGIVSGRGEPGTLLDDHYWKTKVAAGESRLHALPDDAEAIRAFLTIVPDEALG